MRGGTSPRRPRALAALLLACLAPLPLAAQSGGADPAVTARVDAARIGEGDSLSLTIEASGDGAAQVEEPDLSNVADFTVAAGPSVSTSTSMVWSGGQARSSTVKRFTYALLPRRRGSLSIPSIALRRGSRVLHTQPIAIEVVEGNVKRAAPSAPRGGPLGGGAGPGRGGEEAKEEDLFVEAILDRKEGFVGEQFLLTYKVFTRVSLVDLPGPRELPAYTGFWVEEIPFDPRSSLRSVVKDGREFTELTLMKKAIFPTTSGTLTIEPTAFGIPVKVASRDPFEGLFFTPTRNVFRQTRPVHVTVKPLPETGRPASFSGAVGSYRLKATLDRAESQVSEAVGLKIQVTGAGNIRLAGAPALPPLTEFRSYEPKVEEESSFDGDRLEGGRTWEYVLTPLAAGQQTLPPVRFSWFDPRKGSYVEASSDPLPILVRRGSGGDPAQALTAPSGAPRLEVRALGRDIAWIKPASALRAGGGVFHRSALFGLLMALPLLANAGIWLALRRREKARSDPAGLRLRRAPRFARRRLAEARRALAAGDARRLNEEIERAVSGYLGDTLGLSASGLTHDAVEALLASRGVPEPLRQATRSLRERCDFGRFSPEPAVAGSQGGLLEEAGALIGRLDRALAARPAGAR